MAAALADGARRIVVGVGGTGTCDGGAGLLAALGASADPAGSLDRGGAPLADVAGLELDPALATLAGCALEVATDVDVPLLGPRGAARGFAPQKGATPEQVEQLEVAMNHWAALLGRSADGRSAAVALGAGAGGGLGAALIRLGARRVPGIGTVLGAADLDELLRGVDLVITGEGSFDWQSLRGKVVAGVAQAALTHAVPVVVLAGRVEVGRREWVAAGVAAAFPERGRAGGGATRRSRPGRGACGAHVVAATERGVRTRSLPPAGTRRPAGAGCPRGEVVSALTTGECAASGARCLIKTAAGACWPDEVRHDAQ